jgi:hypothetical protein
VGKILEKHEGSHELTYSVQNSESVILPEAARARTREGEVSGATRRELIMELLAQIIETLGNIIIVLIIAALAFVTVAGLTLRHLLKKLFKAVDKQINGERIETVVTAKVPDRGLGAEEKQTLAAEAMRKSLTASRNMQGISYETAQALLADAISIFKSQASQAELKRVRALYASLHSFLKDEKAFVYSLSMLARAMCGMGELLKSGESAGNTQLVAGMMYALEAMQTKLRSTSGMVEVMDGEELTEELNELVSSLDKLGWLFLSYPEHGKKYSAIVDNMAHQVKDKLGVYANAKQYGVKSREADEFLQSAKKALTDINVAAQEILNEILNKGIVQADVELEVLRQDIRMRGLYK